MKTKLLGDLTSGDAIYIKAIVKHNKKVGYDHAKLYIEIPGLSKDDKGLYLFPINESIEFQIIESKKPPRNPNSPIASVV